MPKKQKLDKQLDKLFKEIIHPEELASRGRRKPEVLPEAQKETPRPETPRIVPTTTPAGATAALGQATPTRPFKRYTGTLVPPEPLIRQQTSENAAPSNYSINFQAGVNDWSTLRVIDEGSQRVWTQNEQLLIKQVLDQLSLVMENARLFEESQKFKLGIDRTDNAVFITDTQGIIQYINPGFQKVYGYSAEEAIGNTPRIIKSGLIPKDQYKQFWGTLLGGGTISGEITNKAKDGHLIPISGTNSPILDENGKILGFLSVHQDITNLKKSEEAIKRRNEYLAVSAEIGRLVTSTLDLNSIFTRTVKLISERFDFYHVAIFIVEETGFKAILREATGEAGQEMRNQKFGLPVTPNSIVGKVTFEGNPVVANNVSFEPLFKPNPLLPETRAEAAIPLRISNRVIGAVDLHSKNVEVFTEDEITVLQTLADQVAIAIDNARSFELSQEAVKEMRETDRVKTQFLANM